MRAAFIRLKDDIRAAFIRGRRLFEGRVYIRKYGTWCYMHCSMKHAIYMYPVIFVLNVSCEN